MRIISDALSSVNVSTDFHINNIRKCGYAAAPAQFATELPKPPPAIEPEHGYADLTASDPLEGLTTKQIWHRCVWLSDEPANVKLMLVCIGRYLDDDGRSSSMSYAQIARDCSLHETTAKRAAKAVRDRWLSIEVGGGYYVQGYGHQNLYHAIIPPELIDRLRTKKQARIEVSQDHPEDAIGVAQDHPEDAEDSIGVAHSYPPGSHSATHTENNRDSKKAAIRASSKFEKQPSFKLDEPPKPTQPPDAKLHEACRKAWNKTVAAAGAQQCRKIDPHRRDRLRDVLPELVAEDGMPNDPLAAWLKLCELLVADGWVINAKSIDDVLSAKGKVITKAIERASASPKIDEPDDELGRLLRSTRRPN